MTPVKITAGKYEDVENILHLWFSRHVVLADEEAIRAFSDEVLVDWIQPCPIMPYLLVNFSNLEIRPNMAEVYAKHIGRFESMLLGTYRCGVHPSKTGVVMALSTERGARANIFPGERCAREAICAAKEEAERSRSRE